jgi:hypothetical protein
MPYKHSFETNTTLGEADHTTEASRRILDTHSVKTSVLANMKNV